MDGRIRSEIFDHHSQSNGPLADVAVERRLAKDLGSRNEMMRHRSLRRAFKRGIGEGALPENDNRDRAGSDHVSRLASYPSMLPS